MADTTEDLIYVRERDLPYSVFDADNHIYETRDAFTKFLPKEYEGAIDYVEVKGRTKIAIRDKISHYIPNPTFNRVAVPGGYGMDASKGQEKRTAGDTRLGLQKVRAMPGMDAFFDPEPRLELMKDMGIDRTLMWPTLASVLEGRLADAPDIAVTIIHAFNQWMHEHWSFVLEDAIYSTPIISLAAGNDVAINELEWIHERGAKIFLIRVAPVPTWEGRKSFALPEFDPFWERVQELDLVVGMHSGDGDDAQRYMNEWEGISQEPLPFKTVGSPAFKKLAADRTIVFDAMASIIGHGLATRFPKLKFMPVEYSASWIRPFIAHIQAAYEDAPMLFDEEPMEVFKRNIFIHAFHEPDPQGLLDLGIPADRLMFGSDFPHPEGMADPLAYSDVVTGLPAETQALIMGGTIEKALKVGQYAAG
jgi:predicted TIM-barrel fold metal-dependent hydrolase